MLASNLRYCPLSLLSAGIAGYANQAANSTVKAHAKIWEHTWRTLEEGQC
jgi:hypothetical protein